MAMTRTRNVRGLTVFALILFLGLALVATQSMAARGGNGGKGNGKGGAESTTVMSALLTASPGSCVARGTYTLSGSGFAPVEESGVLVWVRYVCESGSVYNWYPGTLARVDEQGNFTVSGTALGCAGTTEFQAVQTLADGTKIKGQASMVVY